MPLLEYDGQYLCQSKAINAFLAKKAGLAGQDDWEQAQVQMYVELYYELFVVYYNGMKLEKDPENRKKCQKILEEEKIPNFIQLINKKLEESGGKYFVGDKLTLADLQIALFLKTFTDPSDPTMKYILPSMQEYRTGGVLDKYPLLVQHIKTVTDEPNSKNGSKNVPKMKMKHFSI